MRAGLLVLAIAACSPKGPSAPHAIDDDLDPHGAAATAGDGAAGDPVAPSAPAAPATPVASDDQRAVAPPGKGLRTGTIERAHLVAVLDAGLPVFLRQLEIEARTSGSRFIGWQLVQLLDHTGSLQDIDVLPGDVLLAVNGQPISRPEQAQAVWDSLRTANEVTAQIWRGEARLELRFTIDPPLGPLPTR
ncbi:MAG TPA: hypothetical protein VH165_00035 [Kofleriaceae bacterium]|jgi:S1-C subfamily serine protease|nr:hypothetical protein [Kofleriaceae bacterium]